ncbi:RHS repeat domain-containing protein [Haliovirga abyssi]|uniref:Teneurin-like YD-shell domain-containing protein n=1 Tax=Haliovirga abyssi TaxID=2996794 RepID=A0AAU9DHB3_9FUSO|nr:RHS repeat-associated core domain-containing protein [Haliovirga abyssi]BDU51683.1 hypothetical protein HLVA_22520 [Haliovirga abyssi]
MKKRPPNDNLQFQCTFSGKKISFKELLTKVNNAEDIIKKLSSNEHISNKEKIDWITGFRKIKTIINARDVKTIYYYDSLERLIKVEIPTEKIYIKYYYDLLGNIIKILTPRGSIVKQYNKRGELIKEIGKLNSEVLKGINKAEQGKIDEGDLYNIEIKGKTNIYKYDYLGNIIYKKDKKLQEFYYTYDSYNRLQYVYKNKIEEDNKIKEYKYYDDGSIKEVINSLEKESLNYKYYNDGSLKELVYPDGKSVKYEYNKNGNIKKVTDITNKYYKYIYDTRNRLWKIYDNNETDEKIEYQYYMNNKLEKLEEKKDKKTIYSEEYTYDIGNLMTLQGTLNEKKSLDYTYDYDKVGNLTTEINNISNQKNIYMYDGVNRLIRNLKINNGNDSIDRGYTYTTSGNISMEKYKVKVNNNWNETGGLWYNYNEDDELINITKWKGVKSNNNIWECKKEKNSFEYDDNGNLLNKSINGEKTEAYKYNIENRLTKYNDIKRGITGIYKYYPTNQRKSKAVNGLETKFYYSNNKIINDISNGEIKRNLFGLRGIIGREINGKNYGYLKNSHGDTLKLFDSSGTIKNNYEYDKYGKELKIEEDIKNPFRYSGEYTDEESGLQYLRARYYSPEIRRFISRDTYKGDIKEPLSLNLYGYSKGNPIRYVDPSGHDAADIIYTFADFSAGMGDTLSFGLTYHIRELMGTNSSVNFNSGAYNFGEFSAFALGMGMENAGAFDRAKSYNAELKNITKPKADFYVKSNGDVIPSTGYRYVSKDATYLEEMQNSMKIPSNTNGTYFSFEKYDIPSPGKLQVPHDASIRASFDTLQLLDDIRIPYGKWNTTNYLEPLTKDFPKFGEGGATQAITNMSIHLDDIEILK